jgi:processive 1,2-diacylglycerol beta-glucosyltransferase
LPIARENDNINLAPHFPIKGGTSLDILFLSVSVGAGHMKAAEALKEYVELTCPGSRTLMIDTLKYVNPVFDKLVVGSYLSTLKNTPQLYGKLYALSGTGENINDLTKALNRMLSFKIRHLIQEFNPSLIVCTHPFPLHMVSGLKKKNRINVPIVAILTDMVVHSLWVHDNIDAYIVAHEYMKLELIRKGLAEETIHTLGIPVSHNFSWRKNKTELRKELGLHNKTTVLMMGGSLGFGEVQNTFVSLVNSTRDLQIIVITGTNEKLRKQLLDCCPDTKKNIHILGFTNSVADYMEVSDFIVTKPGGMTISEALVKGLPILIISPIPGQEEGNAHFLINSGAAVRLLPTDQIDSILCQIADNPLRIRHMKEMAGFLARPDACSNITTLMATLTAQKAGSFVS